MKMLAAALFAAATLATACSSGGAPAESSDGGAPTESSAGGGNSAAGAVSVEDFAFDPESTSVAVGDEVTWTVADGASDHTVKFDDEESDTLAAGDTYSRTFDEAGEFEYICGIHPQMTGTVTVE